MSVLEAAMMKIPGDDRVDFGESLFFQAETLYPLLSSPEGEIDGRLCLFTLVVQGDESSLERLLNSKVFTELTRLVRQCGFAHNNSNVILSPVPLDPLSAGEVMPDDVRRIAEAMLPETLGQYSDEVHRLVEGLNLFPDRKKPDGVHVVTRLLVGARLVVGDIGDTRDFLDPPPSTGDDDLFLAHETARSEAGGRFLDAAQSLMEVNGLSLFINSPSDWTQGLGRMAMARLQNHLGLEAIMAGLKSVDDADHAHIAFDEDNLHIGLTAGKRLIGPVDVPLILASYGMEEITDWLAESFGVIQEHASAASMRAQLGELRH
jgi:hypothetical protein